MFVQVHQHVLLQCSFPVIDADAIVVSVQAVNKSLNRRLIKMTQVRCTLAGFLAEHEGLWVDKAESVNDDLALD